MHHEEDTQAEIMVEVVVSRGAMSPFFTARPAGTAEPIDHSTNYARIALVSKPTYNNWVHAMREFSKAQEQMRQAFKGGSN